MEEKQLYGALTMYRGRGDHLRRLEQFEKSMEAYDEAYKIEPNDVRLLIRRSRVYADDVKPQQAYADAELALRLEPNNLPARHMQARALYTMGDFERSVIMNYRGSRCRKQPPYFEEGIILGIETIQDCIGQKAGNVMTDFLPIIKQQEALRGDDHAPEKIERVSRMPPLEVKKKVTRSQIRRHELLSRVLAMKYLGDMANDKFFLQDLLEDERLKSANVGGSNKVKEIAKEALRSLNERQQMLRSARPYYAIKQVERAESQYLNKFREKMLQEERTVGARHVEHSLSLMLKCLQERRISDLMAQARRMQTFLNSKTHRTLPNKEAYIDRLYRFVGDGYLSMYRLSFKLSEKGNRRRIAFLLGLPHTRPTSFDSVRANFPYKYGDQKKYIEVMTHELELCENSTMKCWILYELAQMNNLQKNFALSKFYAKQCQRESHQINCAAWWLNACFSMMSGDMRQGNTHEVENMIEEAYEWTGDLSYPDTTRHFLRACLDLALDVVMPDDRKVISQREQAIMKVMDDKSRTQAKVLFKRMATVPTGRRFTVMPSAEKAPAKTTGRRKMRQRGLSVVPGKSMQLAPPPVSEVAGFQTFDT